MDVTDGVRKSVRLCFAAKKIGERSSVHSQQKQDQRLIADSDYSKILIAEVRWLKKMENHWI